VRSIVSALVKSFTKSQRLKLSGAAKQCQRRGGEYTGRGV
jgi:hypothetical protein